jgi:hypothetical protein
LTECPVCSHRATDVLKLGRGADVCVKVALHIADTAENIDRPARQAFFSVYDE